MQYKGIDAMVINPLILILLLDELAEGWPLGYGAPTMALWWWFFTTALPVMATYFDYSECHNFQPTHASTARHACTTTTL